jgi:cytidyltransferase-like protein
MKYVFYGGAFDPLTIAHERIIRELYGDFGERLIIGVTNHDYKRSWKPVEWRMGCVRDFCESLYFNCFDEIEIVEQTCRTFEFLRTLRHKVGTIVVGMDEWKDLLDGKWKYADKLLEEYRFLVIPRTNGVSSTKVREMIAEGMDECELLRYVGARTWTRLKEDAK